MASLQAAETLAINVCPKISSDILSVKHFVYVMYMRLSPWFVGDGYVLVLYNVHTIRLSLKLDTEIIYSPSNPTEHPGLSKNLKFGKKKKLTS